MLFEIGTGIKAPEVLRTCVDCTSGKVSQHLAKDSRTCKAKAEKPARRSAAILNYSVVASGKDAAVRGKQFVPLSHQ